MPALVPPEVTMDPQWQTQIEKDLKVSKFSIFTDMSRGLLALTIPYSAPLYGPGERYLKLDLPDKLCHLANLDPTIF